MQSCKILLNSALQVSLLNKNKGIVSGESQFHVLKPLTFNK
jgi:hypothetical protein